MTFPVRARKNVPGHIRDAVHLAGHSDGGLAASRAGYRAGQGYGPVLAGHDDLVRIDQQQVAERGPDLTGDLLIRPQENAQQVAAEYYPEQFSVRSHDRNQPDLELVHEPGRRREWPAMTAAPPRCLISATMSPATSVREINFHSPVLDSPCPRISAAATRNPARTSSGARNRKACRRSPTPCDSTISGPSRRRRKRSARL